MSSRYARQIQLSDFGEVAQQKLAHAKVLVVGAGGLGVPVLSYLAGMGVGTLGICDKDHIELSNLHRQVIYTSADVGQAKTKVILRHLRALNPDLTYRVWHTFLDEQNAQEIISHFDIVVDATDDPCARYIIDDVCVAQDKPFVHGAVFAYEGRVAVFNYKGGATYRCLFPDPPDTASCLSCVEQGVLGVLPAVVGTWQTAEVIKIITRVGVVLRDLLIMDLRTNDFYRIKLPMRTQRITPPISIKRTLYSISAYNLSTLLSGDFSHSKLLDIRELWEREHYGSITQSVHLPMRELIATPEKIQTLASPNHSPTNIYIICQHGVRSRQLCGMLRKLYPTLAVYDVQGGMEAYLREKK